MLLSFLFAEVVNVEAELVMVGVLSELLFADDLVLIMETIEGLWNKFIMVFESKCLKVNLGNTKVIVCGGIIKDG